MKYKWHDRLVQFLVFASVILLFVEIDAEKIAVNKEAPASHWIAECFIAVALTFEGLWRILVAHRRTAHERTHLADVESDTFHHAAATGLKPAVGLRAHFKSTEFWIDIVSVLPFWLSFVLPESMDGTLRSLRVLRLLRLYHYSYAAHMIAAELFSRSKQIVVLTYITGIVAVLGAVGIQDLEGAAQPDAFGTISDSMWWMIVTMTTVGYGDVSPQTPEGKLFAMILMPITLGIMGAVIGIVGGAFADAEIDEKEAELAEKIDSEADSN